MKYLKDFVLGSSYLVFLPYFYSVHNSQSTKNYSYYEYTLVAPVWFGIWNIISLIIASLNIKIHRQCLLNIYFR